MRPPVMLAHVYAASVDEERHRGEERRHAHRLAPIASRAVRPSVPSRYRAAMWRLVRRDRHSLTVYPCRLPDGRIGRTAVVLQNGDWAFVCRVA